MFGNLIFDGDAFLLRRQEDRFRMQKPDHQGGAWRNEYCCASGQSDSLIAQFRRWLDKSASSLEYNEDVMWLRDHALQREVVNDRYENHTKHCKSCRVVLQNIRTASCYSNTIAAFGTSMVLSAAVFVYVVHPDRNELFFRRAQFVEGVGLASALERVVASVLCTAFVPLLTYTKAAKDLFHGH